jgi:hypothetical protein
MRTVKEVYTSLTASVRRPTVWRTCPASSFVGLGRTKGGAPAAPAQKKTAWTERSVQAVPRFLALYVRGRSMMSSMMPYSFDCAAVMMKSRSTSRSIRSSVWPVLALISLFVISRMRKISRAWMSMSVA